MKCFFVITALIPLVFASQVDEAEYYFGPEGLTKYLLNRFPTGDFRIGNTWEESPKPDSHVALCRQIFGDHSVHCVQKQAKKVDIKMKGDGNTATKVVAGNKTFDITNRASGNAHVFFAFKKSANQEYLGVFFNISGDSDVKTPQSFHVKKTISGGAGISFRGGHRMEMDEEMANFFSDYEVDTNNVLRVVAASKVIKTTTVRNYTRTEAKFSRARASIFRIRKSNDNSVAHIKIDGKVVVKVTSTHKSKSKSIIAVGRSRSSITVRKAH